MYQDLSFYTSKDLTTTKRIGLCLNNKQCHIIGKLLEHRSLGFKVTFTEIVSYCLRFHLLKNKNGSDKNRRRGDCFQVQVAERGKERKGLRGDLTVVN